MLPTTKKCKTLGQLFESLYVVMAWAIMQGFEGAKVQNELNGRKIHQLANIITMNGDYRTFFDDLQVWLEPAVHFLHC